MSPAFRSRLIALIIATAAVLGIAYVGVPCAEAREVCEARP